jgi:hypothetical protein
MMKTTGALSANQTNNLSKGWLLFAGLLGTLAVFLIPELAHAAGGGANPAEAGATKVMEYLVKFLVWTGYALIGITFFVVAWLVLKSLIDWKDPNNREGTVGQIILTIFIGIGAMAVLFYLVTEGQDYLETNVKFASIAKEVISTLV